MLLEEVADQCRFAWAAPVDELRRTEMGGLTMKKEVVLPKKEETQSFNENSNSDKEVLLQVKDLKKIYKITTESSRYMLLLV